MQSIKDISVHYKTKIVGCPEFDSPNPVSKIDLFFPDFVAVWRECMKDYQAKYPNHDITFTETYRSNILQAKYFHDGSSKILKDGMHHFGIAGDSVFIIGGKQSYKGDIEFLRSVYVNHGLTILGMWDPLHVQYIAVSDQQTLRNAANKP